MVHDVALEASRRGSLSTLRSLDDEKVASSEDDLGANCLHYAARGGCIEALDYLVNKRGFNATKRSNVGATAAHDAAATGNLPALQWILANTKCLVDNQDGNGATVLHLSARYGHAQTVEWLIEDTSCDISVKTANYALPLHFAVAGGNIECVRIIVKAAPSSVNIQTNTGVTPVYLASQHGHLDVLKFLVLEAGGSTRMKSFDGMSVLHAAAQMNRLDCVKWLVKDQKVNPNDRDFDGATPLHFASSQGHAVVVEWLLKHGGAMITLDNLGGSPLHNAAEMGQQQCIQVLLENGCDPYLIDNNGFTAAELAEKCHQEASAALIRGEITLDTSKFSTPLQVPCNSVDIFDSVASTSNSYFPLQEVGNLDSNRLSNEPSVSDLSVVADVHSERHNSECSVYSQETGETECQVCFKSSQQSQDHIKDFAAAILHGSHESDLSSAASTLSSVSVSAAQEPDPEVDSDLNFLLPAPCGDQTRPLADIRSQLEHLSNSVTRGKEIQRSYIHQSEKDIKHNQPIKMSNTNGIRSASNQGNKMTVIQIKGNNVKINDSSGVREITTPPSGTGRPSPITDNSNQIPRSGLNNSNSSQMAQSGAGNVNKFENSGSGASVVNSTVTVNALSNGLSRLQTDSNSTSENTGSRSSSAGLYGNQNSEQPVRSVSPRIGPSCVGSSPLASLLVSTAPRRVASPNSDSTEGALPSNGRQELNGSFSSSNSSPEVRSSRLADNPFMNQNGHVPAKHDIIAELKTSKGASGLKKSRGPERGVTKEVFSFGGKRSQKSSNSTEDKKPPNTLVGEWDPKHFMSQVPEKDLAGMAIPDWRRHMLAKQAAEKAKKESEEKMRIALEEARFVNIPAWKRALIEKKEQQQSGAK
ncbi:espin-like isoform X2 [Gigantopelta aegis]|uniref:espin-like isoform X2 n=1 Tax=Gigantopelta aegis TaxID=1735272 RepID=UPI001B88B8AF|nr:espin-like isoform X2 [Gigantopelta aegis]